MERFFTFDKFNTFYDWHLIVTAKDIADPEPKTNYVELDGMNGSLDLSEALTGEITYKDRTITATFWTDYGTRDDRKRLLRDIRLALHGKKIKIIEPDDPDHYLYGRVKIKSVKNIIPYAEFTVEATCDPWRYANDEIIRRVDVSNDVVNVVIRNNGFKTLSPIIEIAGNIRVIYGDHTVDLTSGQYTISEIKLRSGVNVIGFSGTGTANIIYREADL